MTGTTKVIEMKRMLISIFLLAPFLLFAQGGAFSVKGTIGNMNAPAKAYLNYKLIDDFKLDSVTMVNGNFEFKGFIKEPGMASLMISPEGNSKGFKSINVVKLYVEQGNILITSPDSPLNAKISGTPLNEKYQNLQAALQRNAAKFDVMYKAYLNATDHNKAEKQQILYDFIISNPGSMVSLDVINLYAGKTPELTTIEPLYNLLTAPVKSSTGGKALASKIKAMKNTGIGSIAPIFTQNDTAGRPISLSSFRGKYVLLDFWASWCVPCRAENPNVVKAYHAYKDKKFTVVGISLDQARAKAAWLKAIKDDKLEWTQLSDLKFWNNEAAKLYDIKSIPSNYLIDPNGKIIAKNLRGEELQKKLEEILGTK